MIALPVNSSYMAGLAPDEMRGRYQGVISISWSAATMIGPSMGIALYQASPMLVWVGTFLLALVAAGLTLAGGRFGKKPAGCYDEINISGRKRSPGTRLR